MMKSAVDANMLDIHVSSKKKDVKGFLFGTAKTMLDDGLTNNTIQVQVQVIQNT